MKKCATTFNLSRQRRLSHLQGQGQGDREGAGMRQSQVRTSPRTCSRAASSTISCPRSANDCMVRWSQVECTRRCRITHLPLPRCRSCRCSTENSIWPHPSYIQLGRFRARNRTRQRAAALRSAAPSTLAGGPEFSSAGAQATCHWLSQRTLPEKIHADRR